MLLPLLVEKSGIVRVCGGLPESEENRFIPRGFFCYLHQIVARQVM